MPADKFALALPASVIAALRGGCQHASVLMGEEAKREMARWDEEDKAQGVLQPLDFDEVRREIARKRAARDKARAEPKAPPPPDPVQLCLF